MLEPHMMEEWQLRVLEEKKELDEKLGALARFIISHEYKTLSQTEQVLLDAQYQTMIRYSNILNERIIHFK